MKAILVVDAEPMNCDDCPFQTKNQFCMAWVYKIDSNSVDYTEDIANGCYCPLKPMPHEMGRITLTERNQDTDILLFQLKKNLYSDGWNACIEEIEK